MFLRKKHIFLQLRLRRCHLFSLFFYLPALETVKEDNVVFNEIVYVCPYKRGSQQCASHMPQ
jgi:hypothetical protein